MAGHAKPLHTAYLALGSNLGSKAGDAAATVQAGMRALLVQLGPPSRLLAASSLYRTAPVGLLDQPMFVNAVAGVQTPMSPDSLMDTLLEVERSFGRVRALPNGPRTLDLDLLMVDDLVLRTATLTLPHARMAERRFVLAALAEIAPHLRHPVLGRTIAELLVALPPEGEQAPASVQQLAEQLQ